jgi:hypothetical protein
MYKTAVAVLGTLADFHREPIPYNLGALLHLVRDLQPDLLCLDMTKEEWAAQDFAGLPLEYREALVPLAGQTDIVVVPVADERPSPEPALQGVRATIGKRVKQALAYLQRSAPSPAAINQGLRHHLANDLYEVLAGLQGGDLRRNAILHASRLAWNVVQAVRRDPGRRVLVVVNVRYCHYLRRYLRSYVDLQVVPFPEL